MRCLGRFVGCLLLVMVAMVAPFTIWTVLLWGELSNADRYTDSLSDEAYEDLTLLVLPGIAQIASGAAYDKQDTENGDALQIFSQMIFNLDIERWRSIIGDQLDPEWLKDTLKTNLDNVLTYWRFESENLDIQADMTPLIEVLQGDNGAAITAAVISETATFENCTDDQLDTIDTTLKGGGPNNTISVPACDPGDENLNLLRSQFEQARLLLVNDLEDLPNYQFALQAEVTDTSSDVAQFNEDVFEMRRVLFLIDQTVVVLLLLPVMLMSLIVVITVRSAKGFFLWTSLALIETALLTLLPLMPYIYNLVINPQRPAFAGTSNTDFVLGFELIGLFFSSFAPTILVAVAVMAFVGIGFLILAALLKAPQGRAQQPVYYVMPSNTMAISGMTPTPNMPMMGPPPYQQPPQPYQAPPAPASGHTGSSRTPAKPNQRATSSEPVSPPPIHDPMPPTPPPSSAAERYKEQLNDPGLPEDRTFIPTEGNGDESDD